MLPSGWRASLLAVDGAMMGDLEHQLFTLPADVTHIVVSIGGNDVLQNLDVLRLKVKFSAEAFLSLGKRAQGLERGYRMAMDPVRNLGLPMTICTIYNGNLTGQEGAAARVALMAFNDVILRVAFESQLPVISGLSARSPRTTRTRSNRRPMAERRSPGPSFSHSAWPVQPITAAFIPEI
jgi:hypothetical protein